MYIYIYLKPAGVSLSLNLGWFQYDVWAAPQSSGRRLPHCPPRAVPHRHGPTPSLHHHHGQGGKAESIETPSKAEYTETLSKAEYTETLSKVEFGASQSKIILCFQSKGSFVFDNLK